MVENGVTARQYRLGEAARLAQVSRQTLQYYLMVGMIAPSGYTPGGRQLFDDKAVARIRLIKELNETGYPLREIREIFLQRGQGKSPPPT